MTTTAPRDGDTAQPDARFTAGMRVGERLRLVAPQGGRTSLRFWQGVDLLSGRLVGVTLVVPEREARTDWVGDVLVRARRLSSLQMGGLATVLDAFRLGDVGVVVSEWVPGRSLREVGDTAPSPDGMATTEESLIVAVDTAHRAGMALGVDHPDRVRIGSDGRAVLAFPAPLPESTQAEDLRGIGRVSDALRVNAWRVKQWPREPAAARTAIPPPRRHAYATFRDRDEAVELTRVRRQLTYTVLGAAAVIMFVLITGLGSTISRVLDANDDVVAMDPAQLGLSPDSSVPVPPTSPPTVLKQRAAQPVVAPSAAAIFSPDGRPDNPADARNVIDGDPATVWSTDRYYDADPFPAFKQGLGVLVQLREPTKVGTIGVEVRGSGSAVQIRSAKVGEPKTLADTVELGPPVPLQPGPNRIPLRVAEEVSTLLVWITALGDTDGAHRAEIAEITINSPAAA